MEQFRVTVLGVGNILLQDDGVGIHLINRLMQQEWPPEVDFIDGGTAGYDLFPHIRDAQRLIVIDAVKGGCEPGAVYRLTPELLQETRERALSLHQVGFLEALEMVSWSIEIPPTVIIGVEPAVIDWGLELTPAVENVVPQVMEIVRTEIEKALLSE